MVSKKKTIKIKTGRIILISQDSILLTIGENSDLYQTPGGWCNKNESPYDAAIRELKEEAELSLNNNNLKYIFTITTTRDAKPNESNFQSVEKKEYFYLMDSYLPASSEKHTTFEKDINSIIESEFIRIDRILDTNFPIFPDKLKNNIKHLLMYKKAILLAKTHHNNQNYGNNSPYDVHFTRMEDILDKFCEYIPEEYHMLLRVCVWLHDILEDTNITAEKLKDLFSDEVSEIILSVTNNKATNTPNYNKIAKQDISIILKLLDRLSNMQECTINPSIYHVQKYLKQSIEFKTELGFNNKNKELWVLYDELHDKLLNIQQQ